MVRWLALFGFLAVVAVGVIFYLQGGPPAPWQLGEAGPPAAPAGLAPPPLAAQEQPPAPPPPEAVAVAPAGTRRAIATPQVVIPDGRLTAIEVQNVPGLRDGQLLVVGTPLRSGEQPLPGNKYKTLRVPYLVTEHTGTEPAGELFPHEGKVYRQLREDERPQPKKMLVLLRAETFRILREGDEVSEGQVVAVLDPELATADLHIKVAKLDAAEADRVATQKTLEESQAREIRARELRAKGAIPEEEYRVAVLTVARYVSELASKVEQIKVAANELRQAETALKYHFIRSKISGEIKTILKHDGEAVRNLDSVMYLQDNRRLRIDARVDYQQANRLRRGDRVVVEPTQSVSPLIGFIGHTGEVTGLAVTPAGDVLSSSADRTVRFWDRKTAQERLTLQHPAAVRAVACSPDGKLCLSGAADGLVRLWDLTGAASTPLAQLEGHKRPVNCVAFSPDGRWAASGGDDHDIRLWDVEGRKLLQRFPSAQGHRGSVTSVGFVRGPKEGELFLVSAGRGDHTLLAWPLGSDGIPGPAVRLAQRTGDVSTLGVNPAGQVLSEHGKELRILSVPGGAIQGVLSTGGATNFTSLALFSPDGKLILTAGGGDGRLQLWRTPNEKTRGYELRHLAWRGDAATAGAFAPDGSFLVTGTKNGALLAWPMPSKVEVETQYTAVITNVGRDLDLSSLQVVVQAEIDNRIFSLTPEAVAAIKTEADIPDAEKRFAGLVSKEFGTEQEFRKALSSAVSPDDARRLAVILRRAEKPGPLYTGNTATMVVYPK